jgi:uncharacterized protein YdaU (DUF1376 family)
MLPRLREGGDLMAAGHNSGLTADELPRIRFAHVNLNDWRSSYFGATCEEEGFAWRLTLLIYDHMGALPDDDEFNARAMNMDKRVYRRLKKRVIETLGKFTIEDGRISQGRIVREITKYVDEHRRRSQAAREREEQKRAGGSGELPADFGGTLPPKSAGSPAEVGAKSGELPPEQSPDLFEKPNENNGGDTTTVTTSGPHPSRARAFPKPKPKPKEKYNRAPPSPSDDGSPIPDQAAPAKPTFGCAEAQAALDAWNEMAQRCGLSLAQTLNGSRQKSILARLKEYGWDGWMRALHNVERSAYLRGKNKDGWKADLDFLVRPARFPKVHDGGWGNGAYVQSRADIDREATEQARLAAEFAAVREMQSG